jgi:hypothetical protein
MKVPTTGIRRESVERKTPRKFSGRFDFMGAGRNARETKLSLDGRPGAPRRRKQNLQTLLNPIRRVVAALLKP